MRYILAELRIPAAVRNGTNVENHGDGSLFNNLLTFDMLHK